MHGQFDLLAQCSVGADRILTTWGQMTLVVDGYNDDPRELVDIVEVRTFLLRLEAG